MFPTRAASRSRISLIAAAALAGLLGGCVLDDNDGDKVSLSGVASKGPLDGATVCAYIVNNGARGDRLGSCSLTRTDGSYAMLLPAYAGDLLIEVSGGRYVDEATGKPVNLATALRSLARGVAAGSRRQVAVTPLTELAMASAQNRGGFNAANVEAALKAVQGAYGVSDVLGTQPADITDATAARASTTAARGYGLALAAFSQAMAGGNGVTLKQLLDQGLTALSGGGALASYNQALGAFLKSPYNQSGLTETQVSNILSSVTLGSGAAAAAGSGQSCVADITGSIVTAGITVPLNYSVCYINMPAGTACTNTGLGSNASITQNLNQSLAAAGVGGNLNITFTAKSCPANALATVDVAPLLGAAAGATGGSTGGTTGNTASGGTGSGSFTPTCNLAHYTAGAVEVPTAAQIASYAGTFNGDEGAYSTGSGVFIKSGTAALVIAADGSLTYKGTAYTPASICLDKTAGPYGRIMYFEAGNGHFDVAPAVNPGIGQAWGTSPVNGTTIFTNGVKPS